MIDFVDPLDRFDLSEARNILEKTYWNTGLHDWEHIPLGDSDMDYCRKCGNRYPDENPCKADLHLDKDETAFQQRDRLDRSIESQVSLVSHDNGFYPPPWNVYEYPEKTEGWIEFQKEMRKDPKYYLSDWIHEECKADLHEKISLPEINEKI